MAFVLSDTSKFRCQVAEVRFIIMDEYPSPI